MQDPLDFEKECPDIRRMEALVARTAHLWHPVVICAGLNRVVQVRRQGRGAGTGFGGSCSVQGSVHMGVSVEL